MEEKRSITFLPQIDGLRFVAVFGVMMHHWVSQNFSNSFILNGIPFGTGVNLFFVISGFLISLILMNKKEEIALGTTTFGREIKNFYVKRFLRIFPIYYLLILILCIFSYSAIKDYLVYLLTYTINWFMVFKGVWIGDKTHLWSLAIEEQFYLIWPFLIFFIPRRFIFSLIILSIAISWGSKIYFFNSPYWMGVNGSTLSCFDSFGLGALAAYLQRKSGSGLNIRLLKVLLIISIFIYVLLFVSPGYLGQDARTLSFNFATSFIYFFIVLIAANNGYKNSIKGFLENNTILYLGKISYGLYLYHNFMGAIYFSGVNQWFPSLKGDFDIVIMYFLITVLFATVSWYLIERPILNYKKYFQ
jgi:peptidoglycan/LPS O-acetylase OafA/YrhL